MTDNNSPNPIVVTIHSGDGCLTAFGASSLTVVLLIGTGVFFCCILPIFLAAGPAFFEGFFTGLLGS